MMMPCGITRPYLFVPFSILMRRGPVTKHIEDLEAHIRAMYDDLVEEFSRKKEHAQVRNTLTQYL